MSENRIQKEPSTEEILGSIRRIITEDNAQANAADDAQTATAAVYAPTDDVSDEGVAADIEAEEAASPAAMPAEMTLAEMTPAELMPEDVTLEDVTTDDMTPAEMTPAEMTPAEVAPVDIAPEEIAAGEIATADDEIFELTDEVMDEEPTLETQPEDAEQPEEIRREPRFGLSAAQSLDSDVEESDGSRREPVMSVQTEELPDIEQPVPSEAGLTGAAAGPLQGYNYSPQVLSSNQDTAEEEHSMETITDGEPETPDTPDTWESSEPEADSGGVQEEIVSQAASTATAAALGDLSRAVSEKTDKLRVGTETTVSDIVKEMLRPMLREWLDENLPLIVDRVVRREIQKLVDRAQDDE